jgi:hypothetical protein
MSELIISRRHGKFRGRLLTTVSAIALLATVCNAQAAETDSDHPLVWIELGGQLDQLNAADAAWTAPVPGPPFPPQSSPPLGHPIPTAIEAIPTLGWDGTAKISFEPRDSDWIFAASISYGRAAHKITTHDQNYVTNGANTGKYETSAFFNTRVETEESHAVLDFKAGKDLGVGMFGGGGTALVSFGLRYAQFNSATNSYATSQPVGGNKYAGFNDEARMTRNFTGIGPMIAFDGATPLAGSLKEGLSLDWGANASILFGRQKTTVQLSQVEHLRNGLLKSTKPLSNVGIARNRMTTVPNIGGFAGASFRYSNAKISFGYRADFFFGALDGGIDTARKVDRGFFGPFATISIGIGG